MRYVLIVCLLLAALTSAVTVNRGDLLVSILVYPKNASINLCVSGVECQGCVYYARNVTQRQWFNLSGPYVGSRPQTLVGNTLTERSVYANCTGPFNGTDPPADATKQCFHIDYADVQYDFIMLPLNENTGSVHCAKLFYTTRPLVNPAAVSPSSIQSDAMDEHTGIITVLVLSLAALI